MVGRIKKNAIQVPILVVFHPPSTWQKVISSGIEPWSFHESSALTLDHCANTRVSNIHKMFELELNISFTLQRQKIFLFLKKIEFASR